MIILGSTVHFVVPDGFLCGVFAPKRTFSMYSQVETPETYPRHLAPYSQPSTPCTLEWTMRVFSIYSQVILNFPHPTPYHPLQGLKPPKRTPYTLYTPTHTPHILRPAPAGE